MIARRQLFGTTLLGGLFNTSTPSADEYSQISERHAQDIVDMLKSIRSAIETQGSFTEVSRLRQLQMDHLRSSGKFPDFIDAGSDVWLGVHDWHVKHRQPVNLGRDASGRYTIMLMSTFIVLRPEILPTFVGTPYDGK